MQHRVKLTWHRIACRIFAPESWFPQGVVNFSEGWAGKRNGINDEFFSDVNPSIEDEISSSDQPAQAISWTKVLSDYKLYYRHSLGINCLRYMYIIYKHIPCFAKSLYKYICTFMISYTLNICALATGTPHPSVSNTSQGFFC